RVRNRLVAKILGGDELIRYEQKELEKRFSDLYGKLLERNTRESIDAAYAMIDAMMPKDKKYCWDLFCKDACILLDEGDIEGYLEKYRMAYESARAYDNAPDTPMKYTDPLFDKVTRLSYEEKRIPQFVSVVAGWENLAHPASLGIRREIVRDCISCRIIRTDEWQKYFNFCSTHICDDYNLNFGMCWYIPEEEQAAFNNSLVGKNWCHERLMENNKDQIERVIGGGLARGTVARCGDSFYAYCHCGLKESFENLPGDVKNIVTAPEGSKICSIVEIMTAKCFIGCGIEEKLIDMTLEWHKARAFTHAEAYLIERIFRFREPSRFDEMLAIYKNAGFEIIRDLTNELDGRYYILQKKL
ncbi:MAG: hypothetical protein IKJ04_06375, partial [Clostridia bacterium]|nr:hypothetical protein [Clostridia bacterium]